MDYYYPKYCILGIESFEGKPNLKARADEMVSRCRAHGAQLKSKDEAKLEVRGLSATERYNLGKQTLQIAELKRSSVHYFGGPKGAIESPQFVINHGMMCPHSCKYCYWQKDLFSGSRIVVYANPKEKFEQDIKIAVAIWRAFWVLLQTPSCKDQVNDKTFVKLDQRIRVLAKSFDPDELRKVCFDLVAKILDQWKVPKADASPAMARLGDDSFNPNLVFNSGENNDSVAIEHITDVQKNILIPCICNTDNAYLMLRTKSIHYDFLEEFKDHEKKPRIIISPSLIPQEYIHKYEPENYSLEDRLKALKKVADWGFKIFPCFSPLFYEPDSGEKIVKGFIKTFKKHLPPDKIQYYTLGSLRFSKMAIRNIKMIHADTDLDSPYLVHPKHTSGDKYRYPKIVRAKMYAEFIREMNTAGYNKVPRFLQTETVEAWKALMTDKCKDLGLDLTRYESGELDLVALTEASHV